MNKVDRCYNYKVRLVPLLKWQQKRKRKQQKRSADNFGLSSRLKSRLPWADGFSV